MTGRPTILLTVLCAIWMIALPVTGQAQDATITASVNAASVPVNGRLVLTLTVAGADAGSASEPVLEDMPEFTVRGSGTSRSIEIVNFRTSVRLSHTYILIPNRTGTFEVGTASVSVDGETITARPVTVTVTDAGTAQTQSPGSSSQSADQPRQGNDDIFVVASTDKNTVYVGEQVTYTFELFSRLSVSEMEYTPPTTTGFWTVDLPSIPNSITVRDGLQYSYNMVKTALFPTTAGDLTIGPSSITYQQRLSFFTSGATQTLNTDPVTVTVKPLPSQGKPAGFGGAVGSFEITAHASRDTVRAGEVVTVSVSVTGNGNLDLISTLGEPDLSSYRSYPSRVADTIHNSGFVVGGVKTWEYMIVPATAGQAVIDSFSLPYFDPARGEYRTVRTDPISLTVLPGSPVAASGASGTDADMPGSDLIQDIRYLKPPLERIGPAPSPITSSWQYWVLYLLPAGVFAAAFWYKQRRDRIESDTGLRRRLHAWKTAQKRLRTASAHLSDGDSTAFCGAIHECLTGFIADILNTDTGALTARDLELLLTRNGIADSLAERIRKTLEMCDFIRFASIGSEQETHTTMLDDTANHLARLREVL